MSAGPAGAGLADWALDEVLSAIQRGVTEKDALQEATGVGPSDLRRALEALEEEGVIRPTDSGWEADPTATPAERPAVPEEEGVIGPGTWEPPPASGPVTVGVPWESREEGSPEGAPAPLTGDEEPARGDAALVPGVSPTGDGGAYVALMTVHVSYPTPDDPVEVGRMLASRLEELVAEVFGLHASAVLEEIDKTERVYSR